jgi:hypothetical protein
MSNGGGKHSLGDQGKGSGEGAMTELPKDEVEENAVLSNRDKAQHTKERGRDGNRIKSDQYQDHAADQLPED